ncbi:RNA polymerase sigma factor [Altericroceibacterium spongiae]|uniref:RNA polymerase sigma factor n=1 Tax=Altericroceibacterium spongiae TaxID=2320269 RepID=A0A420EPP7_9SPHN|nr:RNA polymerase sigma factor [Altericroceibacterium spongiae]RKF22652.1 RNA polymerase sigma factor [Altericroceibacterium spongiae]
MAKNESTSRKALEEPELAAAKPADAAVRRALIEAREEFLLFLYQRVGNRNDAEELLQKFSLKALERAAQLRDIRSVRGWLGRILTTTLIDHHRRAGRQRKTEIGTDPSDLESMAIEADHEMDEAICNCLHKLLPTLKPEYADVLWRSDILDEPRDRIAASLGTTLNNVTVRLHRARQTLRKRLEEMCLSCPTHGFLECECEEIEQAKAKHGNLKGNDVDERP